MRRSRAQLFLALVLVVACGNRHIAVAPGGGLPSPSGATAAVDTAGLELEVVYLANEGFLVRLGDRGVLVDALFAEGVVGYQTLEPRTREALEKGTHEGGVVQLALASHYHPDHFDPESVARFLAANPQAAFISTPQAADSFRQANTVGADLLLRFHALLPQPGAVETLDFDGIRVEVLNLHHGHRDPPVENLGFVVTVGQRRFVHFGDTEAKLEDFGPYLELLTEPDWALLPFWFLASDWRAEMVRNLIRPNQIAAAHLPTPVAPAGHFARWKSYGELRRTIEDAFPEAWIPSREGEARP